MLVDKTAIAFETNLPEFRAAMQRAPVKLHLELSKRIDAYLGDFLRRFIRARLSGRPGLKRITGFLARSFSWLVKGSTLNELEWVLFTTAFYAKTHEGDPPGTPTTIRARADNPTGRMVWKNADGTWSSAREVVIPPRLEFFKSFAEDVATRSTVMTRAIAAALKPAGEGRA